MNIEEARKIIGASSNDNLSQVRKKYRVLARKYHPDTLNTGDVKHFLFINQAYLLIQNNLIGDKSKTLDSFDDLESFINIKSTIDVFYDDAYDEFSSIRDKIIEDDIFEIKEAIDDCSEKDELKKTMNGYVKNNLLSIKGQLESFLKSVEKRAQIDAKEYIFPYFKSTYDDERQYWISKLSYNPFSWLTGTSVFLIVLSQFKKLELIPNNISILLDNSSAFIVLLLISCFALVFQYISLSPENQYVPARISSGNISGIVSSNTSKISLTPDETAKIGGLVGGFTGAYGGIMIAAFFVAIIGTGGIALLVALAVFGFSVMFGKSIGSDIGRSKGTEFSTQKNQIKRDIARDIESAIKEIDRAFSRWVEKSKKDVYNAVKEGYMNNSRKIQKITEDKPQLLLPYLTRD